MQRIIHIAIYVFAVACLAWLGYLSYRRSEVQWLGLIAYGQKSNGGWGNLGTSLGVVDSSIEIGLRGDNVIVWRKAGEKK